MNEKLGCEKTLAAANLITSVTRIGAIFKVFGNCFEGLFSIRQNVDPTLANMLCYWASFYCCRWSNILKLFSHLCHTAHNQILE